MPSDETQTEVLGRSPADGAARAAGAAGVAPCQPPVALPRSHAAAVDNSPNVQHCAARFDAQARKERGVKKSYTVGDGRVKNPESHSPRTCVITREDFAAPVDNSPGGASGAPRSRKGVRRLVAERAIQRWTAKLAEERVKDPVPLVAREAVDYTGGTEDDYWLWLTMANRNLASFMGVLAEVEYDCERPSGRRPRNLPAALQARLSRVLPKPPPDDIARTAKRGKRRRRRSPAAQALAPTPKARP